MSESAACVLHLWQMSPEWIWDNPSETLQGPMFIHDEDGQWESTVTKLVSSRARLTRSSQPRASTCSDSPWPS